MYRDTRDTKVKMKQQTLAMAADQGDGYEQYRKLTKRDTFLATMEQIVPWQELCSVIEPHYPKATLNKSRGGARFACIESPETRR